MSRLINAERLVSDIQEKLGDYGMANDAVYRDVRDIINEQPTAFDVDAVVEQIDKMDISDCTDIDDIIYKAIEIVKAGVKNG